MEGACEPPPHLLIHYLFALSGWSYAQVVQGGESFVALSKGLQRVSGDLLLLLTPLRQALERIDSKARPLLENPALLDSEKGKGRRPPARRSCHCPPIAAS